MLTMRKIIDIPADRRISFDLPESVPSGPAAVSLTVEVESGTSRETFPTMAELNAEAAAKYAAMKASGEDPLLKLRATLGGLAVFDGSGDYQRSMRDEWD
jgi:hypothetical protein